MRSNKINQRKFLSPDRPDVAVHNQTQSNFFNSVNLPNRHNIDVTVSQETKETFAQNVHQDMTYEIAKQCGYNDVYARYIATQCNNVDTDPNTTHFSTDPNKQSWHFNTLSKDNWTNWGTDQDSRWNYVKTYCHVMGEFYNNRDSIVRNILCNNYKVIPQHITESNIQDLIPEIEKKIDIKNASKVLHALQDMFAHLPNFVYDLGFCKAHLPFSIADNIDALPIRKVFVEHVTELYLKGDLDGLKRLVLSARDKLQEEIQNSNKSSCRI